ncbi:MAG: substrate-binding domain-containing protein [Acidobacteriota bacterium]|nr:substrate-binding domain-containing protein [Acidobacteriota bacterium]
MGGATALAVAAVAQTAELPNYVPTRKVSGTIRICGSPQMGDLLKEYEKGFAALQPGVRFDEQLASTVTAVAGISSGSADICLLGREIWPAEIRAFETARGHPPMVIDVATGSYDVPKATFALMIFVPAANPIASLSTKELERIFAASETPIGTWGELGLKGEWAARPIHLYGFAVNNDKSQIFSQLIFSKEGRWSPRLKEFSNAAGTGGADAGELIVSAVANDPEAIGISNVHYATDQVKALAVRIPTHQTPIAPTREHVADRSYPLTRAVYMVFDRDAAHPASAAVVEFVRYVLSRQGQQAVTREGNYLPLTPAIATVQLHKLPTHSR